MVDELGESRAVPQMRKHFALYLKGIPGAAILRERIMHLDRAQDVVAVVEETIASLERSRSPHERERDSAGFVAGRLIRRDLREL